MQNTELTDWCYNTLKTDRYIDFPDDIFYSISEEQAKLLTLQFAAHTLMKLPKHEIEFFTWLKEADPDVWNDLWLSESEEPYIVALSFLPLMIRGDGRGFPICDLLTSPNYYFTSKQMVDEESEIFLESSRKMFIEKTPISIAQLLVLEISGDPIDIWHFAYKHKIKLEAAKNSVLQLVEDNILVHLKEAEHLAHFVDF